MMRKPRERSSAEREQRTERDGPARTPATPEGPELSARGLALDGLGNRALLSLLRSARLQRKPRVSQPGDPREHEADRAADAVVAGAQPEGMARSLSVSAEVQRMPTEDEKLANTLGLGPKGGYAEPTTAAPEADASATEVVGQLYGGSNLDEQTRGLMESRFGEDFSDVRVHTGYRADEIADDLQARAFTVGEDIVFGEGQFAPETTEGQRLLAHELAHVVQQRRPMGGFADEKQAERDAREAAFEFVSGNTATVRERSPIRIARQPKPGAAPRKEEEVEFIPAEDKWKGTPVSEVIISLARNRVGFRTPQGMILGTVTTDLAPGKYTLTPEPAKQRWVVEGPGVKVGLRFSVDLSKASANEWTLSYPNKLPLTVAAGSLAEPKTFGDILGPDAQMADPLWLYEGWGGNVGPPGPVTGIDDYETIEFIQGTPPHYKVKYRDRTERSLVYAELTPKMREQLKPFFEQQEQDALLFMETTFPMWWSVVGSPPLAPMRIGTLRPYIPGRVPLVRSGPAAQEPIVLPPLGGRPLGPGVAYGQGAGGRVPMRMVSFDPETGEAVFVALDPATGRSGMARVNVRTGEGGMFGSGGETAVISGFKLVPARPALPPGSQPTFIWPSESVPFQPFAPPGRISVVPLPGAGTPSSWLLPPATGGGTPPWAPWAGTPPLLQPGQPVYGLLPPRASLVRPPPPPGMTAKEMGEAAALRPMRPNARVLSEKSRAYDAYDGGEVTIDYHIDDVKDGQPIIVMKRTISGADAITIKELDVPDVPHVVQNVKKALDNAWDHKISPSFREPSRGREPVPGTKDVYFRDAIKDPKKITIIIQVPGPVTDQMVQAAKDVVAKEERFLIPIEVIVQPVQ